MIMDGYKKIVDKGEEERFNYFRDFVFVLNYVGIVFGNVGCVVVYVLFYLIGGVFYVVYGEVNY